MQPPLSWAADPSGDFNASGSWSPAQTPTSVDTVTFDVTGSRTVTFAAGGASGAATFDNGTFTVQPGANTWAITGGLDIGRVNDSAKTAAVTFDGGNYSATGQVRVGVFADDDNYSLILDNGASFTSTNTASDSINIGREGSNGSITLRNGSSFNAVRGITFGSLAGASDNSLSIESGSTLTINATPITAGRITTVNGNNNTLTVTGTGSTLTTNADLFQISKFAATTGNNITISNNGTINAANSALSTFGSIGGNFISLLSGGTFNGQGISFQSNNTVLIDGGIANLTGGTGMLAGSSGILDFKAGTINTDASNSNNQVWVVGDGAGASATYKLNGGTHTFGTGRLDLNSDGILTGTGTVSTGTVRTLAGASVIAPGNSIGTLTITNTLDTSNGATFNFELDAGLTSDLLALGTWDATGAGNGSQVFNFTNLGGATAGLYTLATFTDGTSLALNQFAVGSAPSGFSGNFILNADSLQYNVGAIPEPTSAALVGLAALAALVARRRRTA